MPARVPSPAQSKEKEETKMVGKRKRESADSGGEGTSFPDTRSKELHLWMRDTLDILRSQDTTPSTFDRLINSSTEAHQATKRTKPSEPTMQITISRLVEDEAYSAIEEFVKDVGTATDDILEDLHQKLKDGSLSIKAVEQEYLRVSSLKNRLDHLVLGEMMQRPRALTLRVGDKEICYNSEQKGSVAKVNDWSGTVLTLCGGERSAKQLFSSLAKPDAQNSTLTEQTLPNGITTTHVLPVHSLKDEKEKAPTIGSNFAPPPNLRPLNPPKQGSKPTSTRSSVVHWHNPVDASTTSKDASSRDTYNKQPLSTGQWLTYNVAPSSEQLASPGSKRRHRDRALSTGEPQSAITEETSAAHAQAKEDALFRSVYSSFAPEHDDFGAVVTEQQKNRIWWTRYGELQHEELLDMKDEELFGGERDEEDALQLPQIDERIIEEAISNWEQQDISAEITQDGNVSQKPKEVDDLLQEISELLEVLDSHQRIRNLSQPTNSRALQGQKEHLASIPGDPTSPSTAELDVYERLKSQLIQIIATLPPYMLAKLDGDRLGSLWLSRKINVPAKDQKGTLEDDDLSNKAKATARPAVPNNAYPAYGAPSALRSAYPSTAPAQQYAQRPSYGQTPAPRQSTMSSSYAAQYPGRPPPASQYPTTSARTSYSAQYPPQKPTSSSYTDRYANGVVQQYGHHQNAQSYGQYQTGYRPAAGQTPSSYSQQFPNPQSRVPSASAPTTQVYRSSQSEYQQRAPPPPAYNYSSAQVGAAASPASSHLSSFPGQGVAAPQQRPPLYHQHSSHYGSHSPAESHTNGAGNNGQGRMSPDEPAKLMSRQKAQLNEQQQTTRQESGTPQPTTGQALLQNGTAAPQPNGVSA